MERSAEIVIVGAGAIGMAIAAELARLGRRDIVVLEKARITHGSTWHAAGLVGQLRSRADLARLMLSSVRILAELETEAPIDWRPVGSIRIASSRERWEELKREAALARGHGVANTEIDAAEARRLFPLLETKGVEGAIHVPNDGYVDPSSLTQALARRARTAGVQIIEEVEVTGFAREGGRVGTIETAKGPISCRTLVLAPGVWARAVGRGLGLELPVAAIEHQYAITAKSASVPSTLPALRDPDLNFYLKPDAGALAIGGWEAAAPAVHGSEMPATFGRTLLPAATERILPLLEAASHRIPLVGEIGVRTIINGPIPVTPDGEPMLGPAPGFENLYLAIGFTSGIAASCGAGRALAEWIVEGRPAFALPSLAPDRFPLSMNGAALNRSAALAYARYYALSRSHPA